MILNPKNLLRSFLTGIILSLLFSLTVLAQTKSSYTVKKGDTLYSISKKLEVTIAELKEWNDISGNNLAIGQELVYYSGQGENAAPDSTQLPASSKPLIQSSGAGSNTYYTVKSGDNLYTIARLHNMTLEQLKELNNLSSNQIRVGQKLAVKELSRAPSLSGTAGKSTPQGAFSLYTVKRGESLNDILRQFKMTEKEFRHLNTDLDIQKLNRGQKVTVLMPPTRKYNNPYLEKADLENLGEVPATVYTENEHGATTTNGELYDPLSLTAAHSSIALGTIIFVENVNTGKGLYVRVNDRITGSGLKLSERSYRILGLQSTARPAVTIYIEN